MLLYYYFDKKTGPFRVIDTADLDLSTVSFTYGDSHPTFSDRANDGKEYRKKLMCGVIEG